MSCQQFELYAAEAGVPMGAGFQGTDDLQAWVDDMRDNPWFERNFPNVQRIEAYHVPSRNTGSVGSFRPELSAGLIEMATVHLNELTVIHEVCHVLASARYHSRAHDPWFARTYLEAVSIYLPEAYLPLYNAFKLGGVDFEHDNFARGGIAL